MTKGEAYYEIILAALKKRAAILVDADLEGEDLSGADLLGANLKRANLNKANLKNAVLTGTALEYTSFEGANLEGTVLDPNAPIPEIPDQEIRLAGLQLDEIDGKQVIRGWRTKVSIAVGNHVYTPGEHRAPYFSACQLTYCHPGIYFDSKERIEKILRREMSAGGQTEMVRCYAFRDEVVNAIEKWRAKRIFVYDE